MTTSKAKKEKILKMFADGETKASIKRAVQLDHKTIDKILRESEDLKEFGPSSSDYPYPADLRNLKEPEAGNPVTCICGYCLSEVVIGHDRQCNGCLEIIPSLRDWENEKKHRKKIAIAKKRELEGSPDPNIVSIELLRGGLILYDYDDNGRMIRNTEKTYRPGDRADITRFQLDKISGALNPQHVHGPLYRILARPKPEKKGKKEKKGTISKIVKKISKKKKE